MSQGGKKRKVARGKLITFGYLAGSDDSKDSDYEPSDDIKPSTSTKARKQSTKSSQPVRKKSKKVASTLQQNTYSLDWSHRIPNELLHKVFVYAVYNFTAVPLLCRVAQVCQKWNAVSSDPSLWFNIDLSFMASSLKANDKILHLLRARNVLEYAQDFNLSCWKRLTNAGLEVVAKACRELSSLDLSECKLINAQGLALVATCCKKLESLNLSYMMTNATSNMSIKNLILERGSQLKTLNLAGNKFVGTPSILALQSCSNLKVLDLSCTGTTILHVERLQAGCPNLVELRLSQLSLLPSTVTTEQINASGGFPELELLSLARSSGENHTDDILLQRLLKTSSKLRQLDLRGCERITHQAFLDLPMLSLEQLFLSRCLILCKDLFKIVEARWKHSLHELDVSWVPRLNDTALLVLASAQTPNTVLRVLNLAGSGVTVVGVRSIIDCCPNLTELNLTSCRGVPRGFKQRHDIEGIRTLRTQLHASADQVDPD